MYKRLELFLYPFSSIVCGKINTYLSVESLEVFKKFTQLNNNLLSINSGIVFNFFFSLKEIKSIFLKFYLDCLIK